jgi:exosome complex component RRP42
MPELVPSLLRQELARLAEEDARLDGRGRWEAREITLETDCLYNAEGSAKVTMGGTIVYAGVKFELRTPWPDRPTQGSLMCGAELRPVAGRKYEPGPPSPQSIDIHVLSDQGNIFDACGLAAIAALRTAVVPAERFDVGEDHKLQVSSTPIMASFTRAGGRFVYDPSEEEELGGDERIHITLGDKGHLHSLQKGLKGVFTPAEFAEIFDEAQKHCVVLRKLVAKEEGN